MTREEMKRLVNGLHFVSGSSKWGGYKFEIHKIPGELYLARVSHEQSSYAMSGSPFKTWDGALSDLTDMFGMLRAFVEGEKDGGDGSHNDPQV